MTISIVLVEDHTVVRQGLRTLLDSQPEIDVVGEAASGAEALELVDRFHPQVTILDLMMPGMSGFEVTTRIRDLTQVVILSMHASEAYVVEAFRRGAKGYVLKDASSEELIAAIKAAALGQRYLSAPFSDQGLASYIEKAKSSPADPYETLTRREREIFKLVAEGLSSQEISAALSISPRTVEVHRANLMHKLGLENSSDLIRLALRRGIIT
jgi:DNA-binding NarL/FixJ family response regulator